MAPRSGKRRRRGHPPVPIWVPMPRPCLGSMNIPGPYYMPLPEMYLPPWAIPPAYFAKPMCHCTNDDYCTTNNCLNSTECLKLNPTFCPHGTKDESDLQQNTIRDEEDYKDQAVLIDPDFCSSCGATTSDKRRRSGPRRRQDNADLSRTNKFTRHDDSHSSLHNADYKEIAIRGHSIRRENMLDNNNTGLYSPQTPHEYADSPSRPPNNSGILQPSSSSERRNYSSSSGYAADLEYSDTKRPSNGLTNQSTCTGCSQDKPPSPIPSKSNRNKDSLHRSRSRIEKMHIEQLPDQLSQARHENQNSTCCMSPTDSTTSCKMQSNDIIEKGQDKERHKGSASRRVSECACSSTKLAKQSSKKSKHAPILKTSQKTTSCECRFPPAFNHLSCNGKHSTAKCHCSNNNS